MNEEVVKILCESEMDFIELSISKSKELFSFKLRKFGVFNKGFIKFISMLNDDDLNIILKGVNILNDYYNNLALLNKNEKEILSKKRKIVDYKHEYESGIRYKEKIIDKNMKLIDNSSHGEIICICYDKKEFN